MDIYTEMAAAMQADDVDRYMALLDDDFQYVRHKSNDTLHRDQMAALLRKDVATETGPSKPYGASMRTTTYW